MKTAAIFDVDNTLLKNNITLQVGKWLMFRGKLKFSWIIKTLFWNLKHFRNTLNFNEIKGKAGMILNGKEVKEYEEYLDDIFENHIKKKISDVMIRKIEWHRKQGHLLMILSNSPSIILKKLGDYLKIRTILSSELEIKDGRFTGKITSICYGKEKRRKLEEFMKTHKIDLKKSYFYADSYSDLPVFKIVGNPVLVNPDAKLRWINQKNKWDVIRY